MKKQPEAEIQIKNIIRDKLALDPLLSVQKIRNKLCVSGYSTASGKTLDWHYVSKLMRKVRLENISSLSRIDRMTRLAVVKERHRVLTKKLLPIAEGRALVSLGEIITPKPRDMIAAANVIMKWDMNLLFAEKQIETISKHRITRKERKTQALMAIDTVETETSY